ncbi:MAG TPA: tripartite tricarboxylate transporter substrate binding protein, partial [Burkholderiales bacterium]|nr:tripartite tricarboxylate transporter substrate binding protein [Burkholderiales bacterium]
MESSLPLIWAATLTACGFSLSAGTLAQTVFPAKPLRFIAMGVGFPENTARIIGNEISAIIKQVVVVEPKPGANGI